MIFYALKCDFIQFFWLFFDERASICQTIRTDNPKARPVDLLKMVKPLQKHTCNVVVSGDILCLLALDKLRRGGYLVIREKLLGVDYNI